MFFSLSQRVRSAPETPCWSQSEEDYIVHTCDSTFLLRRHFWGLEQTHHQLYQAVKEPVGPSGGIRLPSVMSCFGSLLKAWGHTCNKTPSNPKQATKSFILKWSQLRSYPWRYDFWGNLWKLHLKSLKIIASARRSFLNLIFNRHETPA